MCLACTGIKICSIILLPKITNYIIRKQNYSLN